MVTFRCPRGAALARLVSGLVLAAALGCSPAPEPGAGDPAAGPDPQATGACSAAGAEAEPVAQEGVPEAVARTRADIAAAAAACDIEALAALAGDEFTASFGGEEDLAEHLRREEASGQEPLRILRHLLDTSYAVVDTPQGDQYVWPRAFDHDRWADVPAPERDALRPVYDDVDFHAFERFGAYIGYRVGIAEDGTWLFFVAGD
jgi:hypothetical protein